MFSSLTTEFQNVLMFNYKYISETFFLLFIFGLGLFYLFYYKKNIEKETASFMVGTLRFIFTCLSWVNIPLTPFILYFLNPSLETNTFISVYQVIYISMFIIGVLVLLIDGMYFLPTVILKMAGLDINDPRVNKVYLSLKKETNKITSFKKW